MSSSVCFANVHTNIPPNCFGISVGPIHFLQEKDNLVLQYFNSKLCDINNFKLSVSRSSRLFLLFMPFLMNFVLGTCNAL